MFEVVVTSVHEVVVEGMTYLLVLELGPTCPALMEDRQGRSPDSFSALRNASRTDVNSRHTLLAAFWWLFNTRLSNSTQLFITDNSSRQSRTLHVVRHCGVSQNLLIHHRSCQTRSHRVLLDKPFLASRLELPSR